MRDESNGRKQLANTNGQRCAVGGDTDAWHAFCHDKDQYAPETHESGCASQCRSGQTVCDVANAHGVRRRPESDNQQPAAGFDRSELPLFAPGPADVEWGRIILENPWRAPALVANFRGMVNGLAFDMGDCRAARVRCIGNGVVPAQAAAAITVLVERSGLLRIDIKS